MEEKDKQMMVFLEEKDGNEMVPTPYMLSIFIFFILTNF